MTHPPIQYEGMDEEAMFSARNYYRWIADIFRPYVGKRAAEIGAGSGNFSSLLLSQNIEQLVCVEPSTDMYRLLIKKNTGDRRIVFHHALFSDVCGKYTNYFDSILYVNVLEHVEKDADELQYAISSLKTGGYLCLFVPALCWLYSDFDALSGHYRRYDKRQLEYLLKKTGFEIITISYLDLIGTIPWFLFFKIFRRRKLGMCNALFYDRLVIPFLRIFESIFRIPIGKNIIVIAKKL